MAKKSKKADDDATEVKKSKKKSKKGAKAKSNGSDDEGYVTVQDLAAEAEIEPQTARVKLREEEIERDDGKRWRWKTGSKNLKAARKALGL